MDMEGAQKHNLKVYQPLNGCVICLDTIPKEYIKKVIRIRDRADTKARICGSVAHEPPVTTSWWSQTMSISHAKVIGKDTLLEETLCLVQKHVPQTKRQHTPHQETRDLQWKGNFEEDDLIEIQEPVLRPGQSQGHSVLCMWREAATLVERKRSNLRLFSKKGLSRSSR